MKMMLGFFLPCGACAAAGTEVVSSASAAEKAIKFVRFMVVSACGREGLWDTENPIRGREQWLAENLRRCGWHHFRARCLLTHHHCSGSAEVVTGVSSTV